MIFSPDQKIPPVRPYQHWYTLPICRKGHTAGQNVDRYLVQADRQSANPHRAYSISSPVFEGRRKTDQGIRGTFDRSKISSKGLSSCE